MTNDENGTAADSPGTSDTLPPSRTNSIEERRAAQSRMLAAFIALSLGLHIGLAAGWLFFPDMSKKPALDLDAAVVKTKLVKLGKPRDEKLLPRISGAKPPDSAKRKEPSDTPTPENPDKSTKQPSAADILKEFEKDNKPKDLSDLINDRIGEPTDEGQLDGDKEGVALTGEIVDSYFARVSARIQKHHEISATISDEERVRLKCVIALKLDADGNVVDARIQSSSGNDVYDNGALAAAKRASPMPVPPPPARARVEAGFALQVCPGPCS